MIGYDRVKENKFNKFILYALRGMNQRGRCIVEKGIAVVQARTRLRARAEVVSTERIGRICRIAQITLI